MLSEFFTGYHFCALVPLELYNQTLVPLRFVAPAYTSRTRPDFEFVIQYDPSEFLTNLNFWASAPLIVLVNIFVALFIEEPAVLTALVFIRDERI